jgi:Rieske Fe-S protein
MKKMTRRGMISAIGVASAGTCVCGLGGGCATFSKVGETPAIAADAYVIEGKSLVVALDKTAPLAELGGSVKIIDARLPTALIIGRTGESEYTVVSLHCPHRGVEVEYRPADKQFRCASLGHSKFAEDGKLIKGMTKESLRHYTAALDTADAKRLVVTL